MGLAHGLNLNLRKTENIAESNIVTILMINMAAIWNLTWRQNQTSYNLGKSQFGILSITNMGIATILSLLCCLKFKLWQKYAENGGHFVS